MYTFLNGRVFVENLIFRQNNVQDWSKQTECTNLYHLSEMLCSHGTHVYVYNTKLIE